jgi:hypothetical protein
VVTGLRRPQRPHKAETDGFEAVAMKSWSMPPGAGSRKNSGRAPRVAGSACVGVQNPRSANFRSLTEGDGHGERNEYGRACPRRDRGFNAHDAGVLKAAYDLGVRPDVISCTSGAIFWTYLFLTNPEEIPAEVQRQADAVHGVNALSVATFGYPKIFAPATRQYWTRWMTPWNPFSVNEFLDRLVPAQVYEPTRTTADFEGIAQAFNDSKTPVIFNAYAIAEGRAAVRQRGRV